MKTNTEKIEKLQGEVYDALGCTELTDERLDELVARSLANFEIDVDEDCTPGNDDISATREAIKAAMEQWNEEVLNG